MSLHVAEELRIIKPTVSGHHQRERSGFALRRSDTRRAKHIHRDRQRWSRSRTPEGERDIDPGNVTVEERRNYLIAGLFREDYLPNGLSILGVRFLPQSGHLFSSRIVRHTPTRKLTSDRRSRWSSSTSIRINAGRSP
jgi:hypothetical protein